MCIRDRMNPSIPSEGITLYRSMRPLLLETMLDAGENYVPLLNLDRAFTTPAELIKTIDLRQNHMMITETYIFTLMRFSDRYLSLIHIWYRGLMVGASFCSLCTQCAITEGKPCVFPRRQYSCMSAYCIYVKDLADKCGMAYTYKDGFLPLFSMYVFDWNNRISGMNYTYQRRSFIVVQHIRFAE